MFVAGEDHSHELEQVNASIERLRRESDAGLVVSDDDERIYHERMRSLIGRRDKLAALPAREAGWTTETTDQTYAEAWAAHDAEGRRQMLVDAGIRFQLNQGKPALNFHLFVPGDRIPLESSPGPPKKPA